MFQDRPFQDRTDAGRRLAQLVTDWLASSSGSPQGIDCLVLGLPRGGVPVAAPVAQALGVPLDVLVVRKIGVPWQPELALGAVGERATVVLNDDVVALGAVAAAELEVLIRQASQEVDDIVAQLRPAGAPLEVDGRMTIVVDDGVATGATARAAASVLRLGGSSQVILATPVAARSTCESLSDSFDDVICLRQPLRFGSVGAHYQQFGQVSIPAVRTLLEASSP
jgi:putative phosphoribosyl transferase